MEPIVPASFSEAHFDQSDDGAHNAHPAWAWLPPLFFLLAHAYSRTPMHEPRGGCKICLQRGVTYLLNQHPLYGSLVRVYVAASLLVAAALFKSYWQRITGSNTRGPRPATPAHARPDVCSRIAAAALHATSFCSTRGSVVAWVPVQGPAGKRSAARCKR